MNVILFGIGKNLYNVIKIIENLKSDIKVLELWDSYAKKNDGIVIKKEKVSIYSPHFYKGEAKILITSDRYENEIRYQLINNYNIDDENIKNWRYLFCNIKKGIIDRYKDSKDNQLSKWSLLLKDQYLRVFSYDIIKKYYGKESDIEVVFDEVCGLNYSFWNNKKIYFKRGMTKSLVQEYLNGIRMEQDNSSPHCYHQIKVIDQFSDVIIDGGAAEGFFSLEQVEYAKKIYIVEGDQEWLEALQYTFAPYQDKVCIIPKWLSNLDDKHHITIDAINKKGDPVSLIKLDIEGNEESAIHGAEETLINNCNLKLLICTYHRSQDAASLSKKILDYHFQVEFSDGYMFFPYGEEIYSELRHGLLIATKQKKYTICIWGAGKSFKEVYFSLNRLAIKDVNIVDSNYKDIKIICGMPVAAPDKIKDFDYMIIAAKNTQSIKTTYMKFGFPKEKLIEAWKDDFASFDFVDKKEWKLVEQNQKIFKIDARLKNAPFEYNTASYPKIISAIELLNRVIAEHKSICRFGDGEFEIMHMRDRAWFQKKNKVLAERLKDIVKKQDNKVLICLADNFGSLKKYTLEAADEIRQYMTTGTTREDILGLLNHNTMYYDTYATRPYMIYQNRCYAKKMFGLWKQVWNQRNVIFVEGEYSHMGKGNDLFDNVMHIHRVICPSQEAFSSYKEILQNVKSIAIPNDLILIKLGPTATVLAYDLTLLGYQAIDIGQLDNEYDWYQMKTDIRRQIPGKLVAEVECNGKFI